MKSMGHHQTLTGSPNKTQIKQFHTMHFLLYIKNDNFPKGATVDTTDLQLVDLLNLYFSFFSVTYIRGFSVMFTVVRTKTKIICIFHTASKRSLFICIILTIFNNEQHPYKRMIVDKDGTLEKQSDVIYLLFDEFNLSLETTGGDTSWLNGKNKHHNIIIHNIVRSCLIISNQHKNKWCCASETSAEVDSCKIHSVLGNTSLCLVWWTSQYS